MATKSLSNKDKKKISELFENDVTVSKIAKEIGFPVKAVKEYLLDCMRVAVKANEEKKLALQKASKPPIAKDLMINKTRDRKRGGVAVMTKEASEVTDSYFGRDSGLKKQANEGRDITARDTLPNDQGQAFKSRYSNAIAPATKD